MVDISLYIEISSITNSHIFMIQTRFEVLLTIEKILKNMNLCYNEKILIKKNLQGPMIIHKER
jgi:hypothetical protein